MEKRYEKSGNQKINKSLIKMKNSSLNQPIDTYIKLIALSILLLLCFFIVKPFLLIIIWSILVAVALYPMYQKVINLFKGKMKGLVTTLFIFILLAIIVTPTISLTQSAVASSTEFYHEFEAGNIKIPPPAETVKDWPLIGDKLYNEWSQASSSIESFVQKNKESIGDVMSSIFSSFAGLMGSVLLALFSLIIAGVFMLSADSGYKSAVKFANRLIEKKGIEVINMCTSTIRSVVKGILLVSVIQAAFAYIGFAIIDLPGAELFALLVLIFAIIQLPPLIAMIPAIAIVFSYADSTPAIIFTIYSIIVSMSDNFLKPILLGKGLKTPMLVILIGALGGMIFMGMLGLFIGPVILAIGYQLYNAWISESESI